MILSERLLNGKTHARLNMVNCQLRPNGIEETRLINAFKNVPMEAFVPPSIQSLAYSDADLPLAFGPSPFKRWLLAPLTMAKLLQLASIQPADKVLMIGCGSGYSLALVSQLARQVIGIESHEDLIHAARMHDLEKDASTLQVIVGALSIGYPKEAPYDVIMIEGAVSRIPPILMQQLSPVGRLVAVLREHVTVDPAGLGRGVLVKRKDEVFTQETKFDVSCPYLPEFEPIAEFCL